eukprot:5047394-Alexandrium_andersonii.AAC.1
MPGRHDERVPHICPRGVLCDGEVVGGPAHVERSSRHLQGLPRIARGVLHACSYLADEVEGQSLEGPHVLSEQADLLGLLGLPGELSALDEDGIQA